MSDRETRKAARQCDDDTSRKGFTRRKPREISGRMETATSGKAFMRANGLSVSLLTWVYELSPLVPNGTVVDFQAFLISCLARDLGTRKCLYCLGRFLIKRGSILPGRLATRQLAIFSSMVWA